MKEIRSDSDEHASIDYGGIKAIESMFQPKYSDEGSNKQNVKINKPEIQLDVVDNL